MILINLSNNLMHELEFLVKSPSRIALKGYKGPISKVFDGWMDIRRKGACNTLQFFYFLAGSHSTRTTITTYKLPQIWCSFHGLLQKYLPFFLISYSLCCHQKGFHFHHKLSKRNRRCVINIRISSKYLHSIFRLKF
eukprot:Gb_36868 [translate_table: standard]